MHFKHPTPLGLNSFSKPRLGLLNEIRALAVYTKDFSTNFPSITAEGLHVRCTDQFEDETTFSLLAFLLYCLHAP